MKRAAARVLHTVPVSIWRRLLPKQAIGLCYHMVSDAEVPHVRHYPFLDTTAFEADLAYLNRHFEFVSPADLAGRAACTAVPRRNEVILTFDDGFAECASVVAPILRRYGAGAIFFVITDLIDNATMFRESLASLCIGAILRLPVEEALVVAEMLGEDSSQAPPPMAIQPDLPRAPLDVSGLASHADPRLWPLLHWLLRLRAPDEALLGHLADRLGVNASGYLRDANPYLTSAQIRALHAEGFTIGAHSQSHRWLQDLCPVEAEREIVESCRIVRGLTGQERVPFAFPYFGGDIPRDWLAELRGRHNTIGLFFDTDGLREDAPFVVQRVFGERFGHDGSLDGILRRAWARPSAWRRWPAPGPRAQ